MKRVFISLYNADPEVFMKLKPKTEEPIICADSGILLIKKLKYKPSNRILIGDLDSVSKNIVDWCKKNNFQIIEYNTNKDFTDGHLAIEYACKNYGKEIEKVVIGGITNNLDHTLGNIYSTVEFLELGHKIRIINKNQIIHLSNSNLTLINCKGHTISLIPLRECSIKETFGLKWTIKNEIIDSYQTRTLRNIALSSKVTINFSSGVLMAIESW